MKFSLNIFFFVIISWIWPVAGQELPPVKNYAPADYLAENQNWAIAQSGEKLVYVANNKGLLAFNGSKWTLYPSPNETIMRSVRVVDKRIYTGCYMEFGYWEEDAIGMLQYTSLSQSIRSELLEDEEFWTILKVDDYVLFQSLNRIYAYNLNDKTVAPISSGINLPKMFAVDESIYFQKIDQGIFRIENGEDKLLYDEAVVQQDEVVSVFQIEGELLILTRHNGFWKTRGTALERWRTKAEALFSEISVYTGLQLADGSYALGTISHGLIVLDKNGEVLYRIDELNGLRNNTVLSLFQDIDNNLWLGLDNGVSYANLDSPFWVYRDNRGIVGSVYTAVVKDDILYLGSNQGLFYKYLNDKNGFTFIKGTQGQVWSLQVFDETLFCGHHTGTYIIEKDRAKRILDIPGTWNIGELSGDSNTLLQGNYSGLYVLNKVNGNWRLKNKIEGFENSARFFEVFGRHIFVNHEYKGVLKIAVDESYREAQSISVDTTLIGANSGMIKYKDDLLYACQQGIFEYDWDSGFFIKDTVLSNAFDKDSYVSGKLIVDKTAGYLWVFTKPGIRYFTKGILSDT
ncbi:MAG: LuxR family transcriptional regulator, partial [Eudoraea sp.]|nr:LuxR family transcriptional regulator [Eudoraea sp.]